MCQFVRWVQYTTLQQEETQPKILFKRLRFAGKEVQAPLVGGARRTVAKGSIRTTAAKISETKELTIWPSINAAGFIGSISGGEASISIEAPAREILEWRDK